MTDTLPECHGEPPRVPLLISDAQRALIRVLVHERVTHETRARHAGADSPFAWVKTADETLARAVRKPRAISESGTLDATAGARRHPEISRRPETDSRRPAR